MKNKKLNSIYNIQNTIFVSAGFTLIELLVAIVIVGIISVVSVRTLYNMVSYRSKQFAIEDTSSSFRDFINGVTLEIKGAQNVSVPDATNLKITNSSLCTAYRYNNVTKTIEKTTDSASNCTNGYNPVLDQNIVIDLGMGGAFSFSPATSSAEFVSVNVKGKYKDALGERDFSYNTSVTKRY